MLPIIDPRLTPERLNFPTKWQAVIFRNYRMVPDARIAAVLGCTEADVAREAARLGLRVGEANPDWLTRGFITVIRSNWYLLPYEQLTTLLDYTAERLEFILKNEDFLDVKLGCAKPACEAVSLISFEDVTTVSSCAAVSLAITIPFSTAKSDDSINEFDSFAASALCDASKDTWSATTAKPLPASPALAASIDAFNARRLVWLEIEKIVSAIPFTALVRSCNAFIEFATSPLVSAMIPA